MHCLLMYGEKMTCYELYLHNNKDVRPSTDELNRGEGGLYIALRRYLVVKIGCQGTKK